MVLSASLIPPEADASELSRRELQSRLSAVGKLNGRKLSEAQQEKKLREACEGFESVFIQKMWQEMRNTLPKSNLLQGREEQFWQGMYDQELAKKMTSAGGIGLADMMYAQLSRNLVSASRASAGAGPRADQRAFAPEAAPMLPQAQAAPPEAEGSAPAAAAGRAVAGPGHALPRIYDGAAPVQDAGAVGATTVHAQAGGTDAPENGEGMPNPPEVDAALAALRAQQAAQAVEEGPVRRDKTTMTSHVSPNMNSGLHLARMAQFEAGSKLGATAVRPPLRQAAGLGAGAQPTPTAMPVFQPGGMADQAMTDQSIAPLTAAGLMEQQGAPAWAQADSPAAVSAQPGPNGQPAAAGMAPQPQKVRYTTNIPPRNGKKQDVIRMLNVDAVGPNSKAGAGLAAYHAQQAAAGQPVPPVPALSQPVAQETPGAAPLSGGQISVHPAGQAPDRNRGAQAQPSPVGIPPLTAVDVRKSSLGTY